jgi:hypothetical protein
MRIFKCVTPVWLGDHLYTADQQVGEAVALQAPEFFTYAYTWPEE